MPATPIQAPYLGVADAMPFMRQPGDLTDPAGMRNVVLDDSVANRKRLTTRAKLDLETAVAQGTGAVRDIASIPRASGAVGTQLTNQTNGTTGGGHEAGLFRGQGVVLDTDRSTRMVVSDTRGTGLANPPWGYAADKVCWHSTDADIGYMATIARDTGASTDDKVVCGLTRFSLATGGNTHQTYCIDADPPYSVPVPGATAERNLYINHMVQYGGYLFVAVFRYVYVFNAATMVYVNRYDIDWASEVQSLAPITVRGKMYLLVLATGSTTVAGPVIADGTGSEVFGEFSRCNISAWEIKHSTGTTPYAAGGTALVRKPMPQGTQLTTAAANRAATLVSGGDWSKLGDGLSGFVSAVAVIGSDIYVGGDFDTAGGTTVNNIAKWNGSTWSALGTGMNGGVWALAVIGTDLYAGGEFTTAGGVAALRIAKWNGSAWSALGAGLDDDVQALAVSGANLYAGGDFLNVAGGGIAVTRVAMWNGTVWAAMTTGCNDRVECMAMLGANLVVGGDFTLAGGVANTVRIASWNGAAWSALTTGCNGTVQALAVDGTDLYVGGGFTLAGGVANTVKIAKWDGAAWTALGTGANGTVLALCVLSDGTLIAGGSYTLIGSSAGPYVAKWSASAWSAFGTQINDSVLCLKTLASDTVFAGGTFTIAGGQGYEAHRTFRFSEYSVTRPRGCLAYSLAAHADSDHNVYAYAVRTNQGWGYNGNLVDQRPDGQSPFVTVCRIVLTRAFESGAPAYIDPDAPVRYGMSEDVGGWERDSESLRRSYVWASSTWANDIPTITGSNRSPHGTDNQPTLFAIAIDVTRERVFVAGRWNQLSLEGPTVFAFDLTTGDFLWQYYSYGFVQQNSLAVDPTTGYVLLGMIRSTGWEKADGSDSTEKAEMLELDGATGQQRGEAFDLTDIILPNVSHAGTYGVACNSRGQAALALTPARYGV